MKTYARWLFGTAAVFNIAVGLAVVFLRPVMAARLGMEAAAGADLVLENLAGLLAAMIGVIYWMISREPERYRPLILLSVLGKGLAVAMVMIPYGRGEIGPQLPLLVMGDLIYATLFLDYLRRTKA